MGAGTKDKMLLIIAARGTERWRAGEWKGRRSERIRKKKSKGIWSANQTLLLWPLISRQRVRLGGWLVGLGWGRWRERRERKMDEIRERDTTRREMEWWRERKEKEKQRREKMERGFTFSRPLGAIGPVCYGLFIPLAPITTQWAALFSSTQYNNSWAILAWHTTGGMPKVGQRKEHDLK